MDNIFKLSRPKSALPNSYFWTWDHSTNWVLDDPGNQANGCDNKYFKRPETYLEDYKRLTDFALGLGIKGICIWGFLRDSHGGVEYAKKVASYAVSKGVAIMPGFGTTWYGGAYYEGEHKYSLQTFLRKHPDAVMITKNGEKKEFDGSFGACLAHPAYQDWLKEALDWLFREFEIGGINLENGDFLVDYHPLYKTLRKEWPADDAEVFAHQGISYKQALTAIQNRLAGKLCTYATYTGFNYSEELVQDTGMGKKAPAMFAQLPAQSVCQWTLTGMVFEQPLPLTAYLDNGAPDVVFKNPHWLDGLRPPAEHSVGFIHQGSQWHKNNRYQCVVSTIKEACLRAYRAGLEGISIHGEVSARYIPYALNYLAFSHFTHWPEDSIRDFGRKTLGEIFGSEKEGETYAEILAHWHAGTITEEHKKYANSAEGGVKRQSWKCKSLDEYQKFRFWEWLQIMIKYQANNESLPYASPI